MSAERIVIPGPVGPIEARIHRPAGEVRGGGIVCHPHPLYGGSMENNVVDAIVESLIAAGCLAIRFNFRGVGASAGEHNNGVGEVDDARAVLDHLLTDPTIPSDNIVVAGYSFGGGVALRLGAGDSRPARLIGVAPAINRGPEAPPTIPVLIVAGERDSYFDPNLFQRWIDQAVPTSQLEVVPGADHFFWGHERAISDSVSRFLKARTPA